MPEPVREDTDQCIALTNAGTRCTRSADDGEFCYQHDESNDTVDLGGDEAPGTDGRSPAAVDAEPGITPRGERDDEAGGHAAAVTEPPRDGPTTITGDSGAPAGASDRGDRTVEEVLEGDRDVGEMLEHYREAATEAGKEWTRAGKEWYDSEVSPALRSAREELRRLRARVADGLSSNRK